MGPSSLAAEAWPAPQRLSPRRARSVPARSRPAAPWAPGRSHIPLPRGSLKPVRDPSLA